jgi:hypothetical protein
MAGNKGRAPDVAATMAGKPTRLQYEIKNCRKLTDGGIDHCFSCSEFPCKSPHHYRVRYGMSMIENLVSMSRLCIEKFAEKENEKWACLRCGAIV